MDDKETGDEEVVETAESETETTDETTEGEQTTLEVDYQKKFSESSREALRLLEKNKESEQVIAQERAERTRVETELAELNKALESTDPDAFNYKKLEKSVIDMQRQVAEGRENQQLEEFTKNRPEAKSVAEALRKLGRAEPTKSYTQLWDENFQPLIEKGTDAKTAETKRKTAPETGKGTPSGDLTQDVSDLEFNKLSLAERKAILKKKGY